MKSVIVVAAAFAAAAAISAQTPAPAQQAPAAGVWRTFEGSLSASGQRQTLPTESGRPAVTVQLSGAVAITSGEGLSRGFRGEVIGFDDGAGLTVRRCVWTDERGDRIFSQLKGDAVASAAASPAPSPVAPAAMPASPASTPSTGSTSSRPRPVRSRAVPIGLKGRYRAGGAASERGAGVDVGPPGPARHGGARPGDLVRAPA